MILNGKKLEARVLAMEEITAESEAHKQIKKIFLILAGDKKTIRDVSLEELAYYFNHAEEILGQYYWETAWEKYSKYLKGYKNKRRAI